MEGSYLLDGEVGAKRGVVVAVGGGSDPMASSRGGGDGDGGQERSPTALVFSGE